MDDSRPFRKFDYKNPNEVHLLKAKVVFIA